MWDSPTVGSPGIFLFVYFVLNFWNIFYTLYLINCLDNFWDHPNTLWKLPEPWLCSTQWCCLFTLEVGSEWEDSQVSLCGKMTKLEHLQISPGSKEAHLESVDSHLVWVCIFWIRNLAERHDTACTGLTPAVGDSLTSRVTVFSRNTTPRRCKRQGISVSQCLGSSFVQRKWLFNPFFSE